MKSEMLDFFMEFHRNKSFERILNATFLVLVLKKGGNVP